MKGQANRLYAGIPIGVFIHRDIGKDVIFRVRRGNGSYGTILGERIQDQYPYFVPDPNADNVGIANKNDFAAAVAAWQALTDQQKTWWDQEAKRLHLAMAGFNLYIRKHRLGEL